jgi:hypothetical protein
MTAIVYLGEILVASLLAIVLLAISHFRMSGGTALFVGGVVGWTLAGYLVHRFVLHGFAPSQHGLHHANPDEAVHTIFLADLGLFRRGLFDSRGSFCRWGAHRIRLVSFCASLLPPRSR